MLRGGAYVDFAQIIAQTQALLTDPANTEWISRYTQYAATLGQAVQRIEQQRKKFHVPAPFHAYLCLSNAKSANITFQLRYLGQIVALLRYTARDKTLLLSTARYAKQNKANFNYDSVFADKPWHGPEAKAFRAYFKQIDEFGIKRIDGTRPNEEHRLESALYADFENGSAASKAFDGIEPVRFGNVRLPFPTPMGASDHGKPRYCGASGGNIDILVRWKMRKSRLCVIELKDENKKGAETPEQVIEQAIVYAVFLRELLRSPCGAGWWTLFGFSRALPKKLHIDAMSLMPRGIYGNPSFCGKEYPLGDDCIQLHAGYFMERTQFHYPFVR